MLPFREHFVFCEHGTGRDITFSLSCDMKNYVTGIIFLLSIGIAAYFFSVKFDGSNNDDLNNFKKGISWVSAHLAPGSAIVLKCAIPECELYTSFAGYVIAPAILKKQNSVHDTLLYLLPAGKTDSVTEQLMNSSHVIWQNEDNKYRYKLICLQ